MKISSQLVDEVILRELGKQLARLRLQCNLTQADLATEAGVSKRTVERMEAGGASQLVNLVRVCRALELADEDGRISYARALYDSPSAACRAIVKRAANGWHFWHFRKGKEWVRLEELRKG